MIGYIGIFRNPTPVCWAGDMTMCYRGWPFLESHQLLSDLLKWYYQIELGCYVHQLMWTEVGRKDSTEMIIHHVATIFLVMWSWCANLTRIGTVTMFLHDLSDIFLESAKCINYASLSKGRKWLSSYCDGTFAVFAITFFVTRLYYFPRYCVFGFIFDAPRAFNDRTDWYGYKIFGALLTTLQVLHIFWFYLIAKMIYGLMKKGEVEGDVRSDAEDEDDTWTPEKDDGKKGK